MLGRKTPVIDSHPDRWKQLFLLALGQKKMFNKPLVAVLHLIVYAGFIIINLEIIEIILDGILGKHRILLNLLGSKYLYFINTFEILAGLVILTCIVFFVRRNFLKISRFNTAELTGFPRKDANIILLTEIVLMSLFLIMNASDLALQSSQTIGYHNTGSFILSSQLSFIFNSLDTTKLIFIERIAWWFHIIGIFTFLNYLPYSKHLHIILAFPNAYYARLNPIGQINNMPSVQNEVLYAIHPELAPTTTTPSETFGAKDVKDLHWHNLLEAFSCTECGRCSSVCPAQLTGKKLSPRKIMMATRDRLEEVDRELHSPHSMEVHPKTLLHDYISVEEIRACTTCNACVEACPVSISPLEIIIELRRALVMEESNAPQEWNNMFSNIENNFAPWKFSPDERVAWIK